VVDQAVQRVLVDKHAYEIEHRIVQKDGSLRYVREQGEVHCAPMGDAIRLVGTVQDISDVIHLQNQLRELATIDELTGALNRRQLFLSGRKVAETSSTLFTAI
jgi:hypothetical protein